MPRTKKTQKNQKKKKQGKSVVVRKPKGGRMTGAGVGGFAHAVCAITDPFCPSAVGSKWPDENASQRSMPITLRGFVTLSADGNGNASALFLCNALKQGDGTVIMPYTYATGSGLAPPFVNYDADFQPVTTFTTGMSSVISSYRVVSCGVTATPIGAAMSNQGMLYAQELSAVETEDISAGRFGSLDYPTYSSMNLKGTSPMNYVFRPGGTQSREYKEFYPSVEPSNLSTYDWTMLQLQLTGAQPDKPALNVEVIYHLEVQFSKATWANALTTPPARPKPGVLAASASVLATTPFFNMARERVESFIWDRAAAFGKRALGAAGTAAAAYFGGPAAGAAMGGMIMDID